MNQSLTFFVFMAFFFGLFATPVMAKPQPPAELEGIFSEFSELEEKFESAEWDDALDSLEEVSEEFSELSGDIEVNVGSGVTDDFKLILKNLRKSILKKNVDKATKNYIVIQRLFFDVMDSYDYEIHPVMSIIDKYIGEAAEAAEEEQWDAVTREMDEVESFFKKARPLVKAKGVPDSELDAFSGLIEAVAMSSKTGDGGTVKPGIDQLKGQFDLFVAKM